MDINLDREYVLFIY